jgi:hypothetical protein
VSTSLRPRSKRSGRFTKGVEREWYAACLRYFVIVDLLLLVFCAAALTRLPECRSPLASRSSACLDWKARLRSAMARSVTGHLVCARAFCQKKTLVSKDAMRQRVLRICCLPSQYPCSFCAMRTCFWL